MKERHAERILDACNLLRAAESRVRILRTIAWDTSTRDAFLAAGGGTLTQLATHEATLEDVFLHLTGRSLRDE